MDMIAMCKERATAAMDDFLRALSYVPADKLTWKPTPTAKSAFEIAAHCAGYSGSFAAIIAAGRWSWTLEEFQGRIRSAINGITTVEEAEAVLRRGIADTIAALDTVKPEQIDSMVDAPHARTPFTFFLTLPAYHLEGHEAQINYLQTCWDDQEVHL